MFFSIQGQPQRDIADEQNQGYSQNKKLINSSTEQAINFKWGALIYN